MKKANLTYLAEVLAAQRRISQPSNARTKAAKARQTQAVSHPDAASTPQK